MRTQKLVSRFTLLALAPLLLLAGGADVAAQEKKDLKLTVDPKEGEVVSPSVVIKLQFNRSVEELHVMLSDEGGTPVKGVEVDFSPKTRRAVVSPAGKSDRLSKKKRLQPDTLYRLMVTADGQRFSSSFKTSPLGKPVEKGIQLKGKKFLLDIKSAYVAEPEALNDLMKMAGGDVPIPSIELEVVNQTPRKKGFLFFSKSRPAQIAFNVAVTIDNKGEQTKEKVDFPPATYDNPFFFAGPKDMTFSVFGQSLLLGNAYFAGVVCPDGDCLGDIEMAGFIDLREALKGFGGGFDLAEAKNLVEGFLGVSLDTCKDGEPFCLKLRMTNIQAEAVN